MYQPGVFTGIGVCSGSVIVAGPLRVIVSLGIVVVADPERLVSVADDEFDDLLNEVDEKEAGAEDEVRQELYAELLPGPRELLADLGQDVEHGGGEEDPAPETEEERGDQSVCPARLAAEAETFAAGVFKILVAKTAGKLEINCSPNRNC